jgi:hypothetical protein
MKSRILDKVQKKEEEKQIRLIEKAYNDTYTDEDLMKIGGTGFVAFNQLLRVYTHGRKYSGLWFNTFMLGLFHGAYQHCPDEQGEKELEAFFKTAKKMKKERQQAK